MFKSCQIFVFALLAVVMQTAVLPPAASAQDSHLGVPPEDFVSLHYGVGSGGFPAIGPTRILPDGDFIQGFQIPKGKFLVITDIEWRVNAWGDQESVIAELKMKNAANFMWTLHTTFVPVDGERFGYRALHLTSGIVLDSSVILDEPLLPTPGPVFQPLIINGYAHCFLRGYLVDDYIN